MARELKSGIGLKLALLTLFALWTHNIQAQENPHPATDVSDQNKAENGPPYETYLENSRARSSFKNILAEIAKDQKQVWTSPAKIRFSDAPWLIPLGGITAALFATDHQYSASLPQSFSTINRYKTISNVGLAGLAGASAGMYLMSFPSHNEHWQETGLLAGEAALNSLIPIELMKYSVARERPYDGNGGRSFLRDGPSFPSERSAAAWSIAGVIAHEYPGIFPKLIAYGVASAIDFSQVHDRQHFPSDVLVGSVLGYLVAQSIYSRRHDPELGGRAWDRPSEFISDDKTRSTAFMGSPYVPLDSWIYPALERLAALGYVKTAVLGLRPWTRSECARLLNEAELQPDNNAPSDVPSDIQQLFDSLLREFGNEFQLLSGEQNLHAQVESVYIRATGVAGKPLTDNEHFGQTILNDYGRPYREGFNSVAGVSSWAAWGPFVVYARGEYQSAPSAPAPSASVLAFIASTDNLPPNAPQIPIAAVNRFQPLDSYVGMNLGNWQLTFGKQSLWWGPEDAGTMLLTNNAEPLNRMFRVNRISPLRLPWVLGYLGDIRMEFFLGQLSGQEFINNTQVTGTNSPTIGQYGRSLSPQPYLSGGKISFKFTPNFEIGMSKTTIYGGPGNPLTPTTFIKSAFSFQGKASPIGDGRTALDFSYRIPKLRNWLSFYGDAFQEDEISPLNRPYKAAFQAGIYSARIFNIPKLDLRLEGGTTSPINFPSCDGCYYSNGQYVSGYTNQGDLIGTWLGRGAQGEAVRSNYWLAPQMKIGIELRHRKIDQQYLRQGGTQNDAALNADFLLKSGIRLSGSVQFESWGIPLLATSRQSNVAASFGLGYWPQGHPR